MCFSAEMSLGFGLTGLAASAYTYLDPEESLATRIARAYPILHFSGMEFIQYFAYPVADQCGYGTNLMLSQLSTYHISLQSLAIMPALASYSTDKTALYKATWVGLILSSLFLIFNLLPSHWQLFSHSPTFIGDLAACLFMGRYHIGYHIPSAFSFLVIFGTFYALALSAFTWPNNWRIGSYHLAMSVLTLYLPQWLFDVSTGEAAAIYCLYSIPITCSFMPCFKRFFTGKTSTQQHTAKHTDMRS